MSRGQRSQYKTPPYAFLKHSCTLGGGVSALREPLPRSSHSREREERARPIDIAVESFTTHKHLVLHAPSGSSTGRAKSRVMVARQRDRPTYNNPCCIVIRSSPLPSYPLPPLFLTPAHFFRAVLRHYPACIITSHCPHAQNRYVLINVWTWCGAAVPKLHCLQSG